MNELDPYDREIHGVQRVPYFIFPGLGGSEDGSSVTSGHSIKTRTKGDTLIVTIDREYTVSRGGILRQWIVSFKKTVPIEYPENIQNVVFITLPDGTESRYRFIHLEDGTYDIEPTDDVETIEVLILPASIHHEGRIGHLAEEYRKNKRELDKKRTSYEIRTRTDITGGILSEGYSNNRSRGSSPHIRIECCNSRGKLILPHFIFPDLGPGQSGCDFWEGNKIRTSQKDGVFTVEIDREYTVTRYVLCHKDEFQKEAGFVIQYPEYVREVEFVTLPDGTRSRYRLVRRHRKGDVIDEHRQYSIEPIGDIKNMEVLILPIHLVDVKDVDYLFNHRGQFYEIAEKYRSEELNKNPVFKKTYESEWIGGIIMNEELNYMNKELNYCPDTTPYLIFPGLGYSYDGCELLYGNEVHTLRDSDTFNIYIERERVHTKRTEYCARFSGTHIKTVPIEDPEHIREVVITTLPDGTRSRYRFVRRESGIYDMEPIDDLKTIGVVILPAAAVGDDEHLVFLTEKYRRGEFDQQWTYHDPYN